MTIVYVIGLFPKTSETFILGEIQELERQGERVQICSLRPRKVRGPLHPGTESLVARTLYVRDGLSGVVVMLAAVAHMAAQRPRRTFGAAVWALRWAWRSHSPAELARFGQACVLARRLRVGDHIHAHFAHGPASAALILSRLTGVPFSFTGHAREIFETFRDPVLAAKAAEARFVVAISEHGRRRLLEAVHPADRHKVVLVRNGIDLACFAPAPAYRGSTYRVVSVARAVPMKGLSTLVDACAVLGHRGLDVTCEIVGDGPLLQALKEQVDALGLAGRVRLAGSGTRDDVLSALRRADVFALPSRHDPAGDMDGLPVSVVEAMAVGLPVVSTPVTGIPEVVEHGRTGLLVPPDEPEMLADALHHLFVNRRLRNRLSRGALERARGFDRAEWVRVLRGLYAGEPDVAFSPPDATGRGLAAS